MVLESTVICVDNSDFMRNGDFQPSRMQAQHEAVNLIANAKTRSNPENNVALVTLANSSEVLTTLTTDVGKVMAKLQQVQPKGEVNFVTGVRIAHLALRHRQGRNHRMRIVVFVGSPLDVKQKELSQLAKKLKKEKVSVDIINFGEDQDENNEVLQAFIEELRGKDGTGSHLATLNGGCDLVDTLARSPIVKGEDGSGAAVAAAAAGGASGGFDFGIDPNEDPELAMALRVSMEEQRQRQERDARAAGQPTGGTEARPQATTEEEQMLVQALTGPGALDGGNAGGSAGGFPDFGTMSEEDQIAYAIQMSMQEAERESSKAGDKKKKEEPKKEGEKDDDKREKGGEESMDVDMEGEEDLGAAVQDAEFLQQVLGSLPGVDPQSEAVRSAVGSVARKEEQKDGNKKDDDQKS
jgi:26S proteasome regulatory subunit N10